MRIEPKRNIFDSVVDQDLCIGCGACLYPEKNRDLNMSWNKEGFLIPMENIKNSTSENNLKVCPFNPFPDKEVRTENEIASIFLPNTPNKHPIIGRFFNTYAGYSSKYRLTSSSGGMATYLIDSLFINKIVDAVITVKYGEKSFYEYSIVRSDDNILSSSETKYYPVSFGSIIDQLKNSEERFAIVGVACFIKSIRLLQHYHSELKEKIKFTIGIICGGVKSNFYTEFLSGKLHIQPNQIKDPKFRIKNYKSTAGDYSFKCTNNITNTDSELRIASVGDMWGTGMFKAKACDFCDDLTTELADISLGDAWIEPYKKDGRGTNVIVTRSILAEKLINDGIKEHKLIIDTIPTELFIKSQRGNFNHRHLGLGYRMKEAKKKGDYIPPKRFDKYKISLDFKLVQNQRSKIREKSLVTWMQYRNVDDFDRVMQPSLKKLKKLTRIYHLMRRIREKYLLL